MVLVVGGDGGQPVVGHRALAVVGQLGLDDPAQAIVGHCGPVGALAAEVGLGAVLDPADTVVLGLAQYPGAGEAFFARRHGTPELVEALAGLPAPGAADLAEMGGAGGTEAAGAAVQGAGLPGAGVIRLEVADTPGGVTVVGGNEAAAVDIGEVAHFQGRAEGIAGDHPGGFAPQAVVSGVDIAAPAVVDGGIHLATGVEAGLDLGPDPVAEGIVAVGGLDIVLGEGFHRLRLQ